jgi:ubiquinone/menaquinone biosynthesis C-methylase UbiE
MPKVNTLHLALGIHGLAILRCWKRGGMAAQEAVDRMLAFGATVSADPARLERELTERDVGQGYAEWSTSYDAPGNPLIAMEEPVVHGILDALPRGVALDAACGTGRHTKYLAEHGFETTGIDGSEEMLAIARTKVPAATLRHGDLLALDLPDARFDVVVCALALDHVDDLNRAVGELARVARPGATLVISTLHPTGPLLGGGAFYRTEDGIYGIVRGPERKTSDYVKAFRAARLVIEDCIEPEWREQEIEMLASSRLAPETYRTAMVGMPSAMIWRLERGPHT